MSPILSCQKLEFYYRKETPLLFDINLKLEKGGVGVLIGRSGTGKTSLFKLFTGFLKPISGEILLKGKSIDNARDQISFMTHSDLLLPWRSVINNILLPAELSSSSSKKLVDRADYLLDKVGLYQYRNELPEKLSQGMRQRVALVRTLLLKRPFILLDEPFGSLDLVTRHEMYELVYQLVKEDALSLLLITHDIRDCQGLADELFILKNNTLSNVSISSLQGNLNSKRCKEMLL